MSEHKIDQSNWTAEDKKLYQERRQQHVRGQVSVITVHQAVTDEQGQVQRLPIGSKLGSRLSRAKQPSARAQKRMQWKAWRKEQRKANNRGA